MNKYIIAIALVCVQPLAFAETFQGIGPLQTLKDIQAKFPNAKFAPVKAAWVTENDAFYALSGEGFPGKLYIAFSDGRPAFTKEAQEKEAMGENADSLRELAAQSNGDALTIEWMRWAPTSEIPVQRYFMKYGKKDKAQYRDADMKPYFSWPEKGVQVNVSDDEKMVQSVEFSFTRQERLQGCLVKYSKALCEKHIR